MAMGVLESSNASSKSVKNLLSDTLEDIFYDLFESDEFCSKLYGITKSKSDDSDVEEIKEFVKEQATNTLVNTFPFYNIWIKNIHIDKTLQRKDLTLDSPREVFVLVATIEEDNDSIGKNSDGVNLTFFLAGNMLLHDVSVALGFYIKVEEMI